MSSAENWLNSSTKSEVLLPATVSLVVRWILDVPITPHPISTIDLVFVKVETTLRCRNDQHVPDYQDNGEG